MQKLHEIDPTHLENLESSNHFSVFIPESDYQILILRSLELSEDKLKLTSNSFLISGNDISKYDNGRLIEHGHNLSQFDLTLKNIFRVNELLIERYIQEIDHLEDTLFDRKTSRIFMDIWFDLKKDLARIERYYSRTIIVLNSMHRFYLENELVNSSSIQDLINDVSYTQHKLGNQTAKLDALYNYYGSIRNDKLNNNIYTLTIISAVFLPLNLIVGFFGMNTENLFFKDNSAGTQLVLFILLSTFIISLIGIPLIRFLDKYVLKYILGRSNFYKKMSEKLEKIEERMKV